MASTLERSRHPVATFDRYEEAQAYVDELADRKLPVEHIAIVGSDLHYVEQVTGRMTTGKAALAGAGSGAWLGLLFSLFFALFMPGDVSLIGVVLYWAVVGAIVGAIFGAIAHAMRGGDRDFSSVTSIQPSHFQVQVTDDLANQLASERLDLTREERRQAAGDPGTAR